MAVRRVVWLRALAVVLLAAAWLAWHPELFATHPPAPAFLVEETRSLGAGVTLRKGRVEGTRWRLVDVAVELSRARLRVATGDGGGALGDLLPEETVAAVNGAFFERDLSPHGWVVDDGWELHALNLRSPTPIFAVSGSQTFIGPRAALPFVPELALQNFPLLVEEGVVRVAERASDPGYPRTLVCLTGDGLVHLVVVLPERGLGPSLFDTARVAAWPLGSGGLGCRAALNLDGGPSSGYWAGPADQAAPGTPIGHALAVVPR